ncbi:MAG: M20/M25/M40 family metallo-hydrolase [Lacipirellulaceae bacterium]
MSRTRFFPRLAVGFGEYARIVFLPDALCLWLCLWAGAVSAANERHAMLDAALATITSEEVRDHAGVLAGDSLEGREAGSRGGRAAAGYLKEQLERIGAKTGGTDGYSQRFHGTMQNLIAVIPGTDEQVGDEVILIGAHYDHVGYGSRRTSYGPYGYIHNGADDNASGVAAMLETIDALVQIDFRPRRTLLFVFWDGEEKNLLGSKHWLSNPTVPLEKVKLVINLDMIGRMVEGRVKVGGARTALGLRELLSSERLPEGMRLDFSWEYKSNSDHWPFYQRQIPSLYFHTGLHDDYHRPTDDVEKLNVEGIRLISQYLVGRLTSLADLDSMPTFRPESHYEDIAAQTRLEAPLPPHTTGDQRQRLGIAWRADPGEPNSVFITRVTPGTPAEKAGLAVHDRLLHFNGVPIEDRDKLLTRVRTSLEEDVDALHFKMERDGRIRYVRVKLREPTQASEDPTL